MRSTLEKILINLINAISKTWRLQVDGKLPNEPSIVIFWHRYLLAAWKFLSKYDAIAVVSPSKDGNLLSSLLSKWGYRFIRGSSDKSSKEVLSQIVELANSNIVSLTPDGPRGPVFKLKPGAVVAAHRTGVPIYYIDISTTYKKIFTRSWDGFEFPLPFSKIKINISDPILVPSNFTKEEIANLISEIENMMKK